jgi:ABC-type polysaccharide/polyol phosphate export permease
MGIGLIIGTLSIFLKDIQHLWDMLLLLGFWLTPILYDKTLIEENLPWLLYLNPVSGIIINIREVLLYARMPDFQMFGFTIIYAIVVFIIGYFAFNKYSHKIAEKI